MGGVGYVKREAIHVIYPIIIMEAVCNGHPRATNQLVHDCNREVADLKRYIVHIN